MGLFETRGNSSAGKLFWGHTMLSVQNSFYSTSALDGVYASMAQEVSSLPSMILLTSPDRYTGTSLADNLLRISIAENTENTASVNAGMSLVQSAVSVLETISEKVDQMKELAQEATTTPKKEDREALQEQFDELSEQVNAIAVQFGLGGNMFTKDGDSVEVSIGSGLSISIDTKNLTISGLGIINNVDIVNDAAGAVAGLELADGELNDYMDHLEEKLADLASVADVLDAQSQNLLAVQAGIQQAGSAMAVANSLNSNYFAQADLFLAAQVNANIIADTVLRLLAD